MGLHGFSFNMELIVKDIMKKLANDYTHMPTVNETIESLHENTADAVIQIIKNNEYNNTELNFTEEYNYIIENNLKEPLPGFINHVINKIIEHDDVKKTLKIPLQNNREKVVEIIVNKSFPKQQGGKKTKKSKKNKKNKNKKTKKRRRRR